MSCINQTKLSSKYSIVLFPKIYSPITLDGIPKHSSYIENCALIFCLNLFKNSKTNSSLVLIFTPINLLALSNKSLFSILSSICSLK